MSKLGVVVGAAAGYVLGARAGRGRYEQIQQQAQRLWTDPRVQKRKAQAQEVAQQKGAQVRNKVAEATGGSDPSKDTGAAGTGQGGMGR